jgi:hypothetical protein
VLGALGWLLVVAVDRSTPDVAAAVAGFDVVSQQRTDIAIEIRRAVPTPVICDVFRPGRGQVDSRRADRHAPAAAAGTQTVTVQIATVRRATTAGVRGCSAAASSTRRLSLQGPEQGATVGKLGRFPVTDRDSGHTTRSRHQ